MSEESTAEIVGSQGLPSTASCCDGFLVPKLKLAKSSGKKGRDTSFVVFDECHAEGHNPETSVPAVITDTPTLPASLKRAVSQPRLHTSLDGSVRIKTGDSPSPLPPRPHTDNPIRQPRALGPLQRSQSAFVPPTFGKTRSAAAPGRSRDSRTWAFYCDSEARDELTKQAEREQSGSAVGAIGLIRSRSKGSLAAGTLINATNNKRASPSIDAKKPANQKRLKAEDISAKASDANLGSKKTNAQISALAKRKANPLGAATMTHPFINQIIKDPRLRSTNDRPKTEKRKALMEFETEVDGNESDKENWAPGTQTVVSPVRRQMHPPANMPSASVLRDNSSIPSTSTSLGTMLGRSATSTPTLGKGKGMTAGKRNRLATKKDEKEKPAKQGPAIKEDVENMANEKGKEEEAPAEEEDLSCVQGLLSLSQGEWR
ncbi:MAG: hypothetical protein Q9228_003703 [Teloschistes exilis]